MFEAAPFLADVVQKEPYKSDAMNSAFAMHFGIPPYKWYGEHPDRAARFAAAMAGYVHSQYHYSIIHTSSGMRADHTFSESRPPGAT